MTNATLAVEVQGLTKQYGHATVVDQIDLAVPEAAITGFVGPNGAGKTTTMAMLLGLIRPTAGGGTVLGKPLEQPGAYLAHVGAMINGPAFHPALSARDNLRVLTRVGAISEARIDPVLRTVGLHDRADDRYRSFSLGMKQRLGIAAALLPEPELLILDEPTNGLDPAGIIDARALLEQLTTDGTTVFVSSHLLAEVEAICDHLIVITDGTIRFSGPLDDLHSGSHDGVTVAPEHTAELTRLQAIYHEHGFGSSVLGDSLRVDVAQDRAAELNVLAARSGVTLIRLMPAQHSLEDAFLHLTTSHASDSTRATS